MWGAVITGLLGAVAGGVRAGVMAAKQNRIKTEAYREAADEMKKAAEEHSGEKLYQKMLNEGNAMAYQNAMANQQAFTQNRNPGQTNNLMSVASEAASGASEDANYAANAGRQLGMEMEKGKHDAAYNATAAGVEQMLKQADIDFNIANQANQEISGAIGDVGKLAGNLFAGARESGKARRAAAASE